MKEVEAKKQGTEILLDEMGVQRSEAEAQQVDHFRGNFSVIPFLDNRDNVKHVLPNICRECPREHPQSLEEFEYIFETLTDPREPNRHLLS